MKPTMCLVPAIKDKKTLQRLCLDAYWVGMASVVNEHCQNCPICQQAKLTSPPKAPLVSFPIGRPWEMLAVNVLEVPISTHGNHDLLVVQDYFTKLERHFPCQIKLPSVSLIY